MIGQNDKQLLIFGATGDLAYRKLFPSLYYMIKHKKTATFRTIIAVGRKAYTQKDYHDLITSWLKAMIKDPIDEACLQQFINKVFYYQMDINNQDDYHKILKETPLTRCETIVYYAVSPTLFMPITESLLEIQMQFKKLKVVVEKPFGKSLKEARKLNQRLEDAFGTENIYRIDHYLGKEMLRSILTLRFENPVFTSAWNNHFIESVEISALELLDVEGRKNYYDHAGALKDMVQNHLFQILALVAMEKPSEMTGQMRSNIILKKLRKVSELEVKNSMILGQYEGYDKDSTSETYAELKLFIDNKRWQNVPFYIRTGKKLDKKELSVKINFKNEGLSGAKNQLVIMIQPTEGVSFSFNIKRPGTESEMMLAEMDFCQSCQEEHRLNTPEAYEQLFEAMINDEQSWFTKWQDIETSWRYIDQLKAAYKKENLTLHRYQKCDDLPKL